MIFRKAVKEDVPGIVQLLASDKPGQLREEYRNPLPDANYQAFGRISQNQKLVVAENESGKVIATLQLGFKATHEGMKPILT